MFVLRMIFGTEVVILTPRLLTSSRTQKDKVDIKTLFEIIKIILDFIPVFTIANIIVIK